MKKNIPYIAIFASGSGSNAVKIIEHFRQQKIESSFCVLSNKPQAPVLTKAKNLDVETLIFNRTEFFNSDKIVEYLQSKNISLIVLAGFLWLVPENILKAFSGKIINIHPALLPKYGGKGMFGMRVHQAVVDAKENETGITIHYVDEEYDHGKPILQKSCPVTSEDTPETVAKKVQQLEHKHFPIVTEQLFLAFLRKSD